MYQYTPIDTKPRTFRLIKLLPSVKHRLPSLRATVRIEIIEADLDAICEYDALSYAWNVGYLEQPDRRVIVETQSGSHELPIFRSLELALVRLAANYADRPLFVDQICINQSDNDEKGKQVQLMQDIYTKCIRVIVWLGPASRLSDRWFDSTSEICKEGILSRLIAGQDPSRFLRVFDAVMNPNLEVQGTERRDRDDVLWLLSQYGDRYPLDGLTDVLKRTWFNRLWIIQEACLAPNVIFVCGDRSLCFDCFRCGTLFFNIYNTHWVNNLQHSVSQQELNRRNDIFSLTGGLIRIYQERKAIHKTGRRQQLYDLVLKYNVNDGVPKIGATLPEDRLYGLLGLMEDNDSLHGLVVQYGNVNKVYTEFAGIMARRNLDLLLFSQSQKRISGLPSWVPDWSMDLKLPHSYTNLTTPAFMVRAAPDNEPEPQYDLNLGRLAVKGTPIDRIIRVGEQTLGRDVERQVTELVDFRSVKRFSAEVDEFLQRAGENPLCPFPYGSNDEVRSLAAARLSDSGLTEKLLLQTSASTAEVGVKLCELHQQVGKWGQRLIDTDRAVQSYHITRIIGTIGIIPWYCVPVGEVDVLRFCAVDPVSAFKIGLRGASLFLVDVLGICASSAVITIFYQYLRLRHRFTRVDFKLGNDAVLKRVGLDADIMRGKDMSDYRDYLLKNIGRKVYLTEKGYVGLGPASMVAGDFAAIIFGSTVPHILRPRNTLNANNDGDSSWSYVGEAYCDGVMEAEVPLSQHETAVTFNIF